MRNTIFSLQILLCMSLFFSAAQAQELTAPDREQRKGMSYQEYSSLREKMRLRMEKMQAKEPAQQQESADSPRGQRQRAMPDSRYGQGYQSRSRGDERPDNGAGGRPERPERFNRGDMGRH